MQSRFPTQIRHALKLNRDTAGTIRQDEAVAAHCLADDPGLGAGPKDLIGIEVFEIPELKADARVSEFGEIDLPLVGKVSHTILEHDDEPPGMGIVFDLDDATRGQLVEILRELEAQLHAGKLPTGSLA